MSIEMQYGRSRTTAAVCNTGELRAKQLVELATACHCDLVPLESAPDFLLADISSESGRTEEDCSEIAGYLCGHGAEALVWIGVDQLDSAFAALPADRCHFLVDADDALAVPILARASRRAKMDQLHEGSREGEYRALHKISDELADFARTLARIAEQEDVLPPSVNDRPVSFRPAPAAIFEPLVAKPPAQRGPTANAVRDLIKLRRIREQHFPANLFADPGWDILLDLFAAKLEGKSVSVSSLCIAAAVPPTTGLRWITTMTEHGALVRRQDPNDARRVFIELSADSEERLRAFFSDAEARGGLVI
jgi:hypothetical protein